MRDLRSLMLLALAMLSLPVLALTADGGDPVKYNLKINKQPLSTALQEFATQYGVQIVFFAKVTDGHEVPSLEGKFTAADAMTRLLEHTNLTFQQLNPKTIEVQPKAVATDLQTTGETSSVASKSVVYLAQADVPFAPNSAPSETTRPTEGKDGETRLETVTITGTRIVRDGYSSPTPVTVAPVEELLETTPTNIADALNKLPQFSVQFTTQSNTNAGAPAGNFLNLRGLGQGRTLVMMDGVRVPGTSATGTVDLNTLPQALVDRVEIVTGGASAIYGSDAVGGVVNYILNTKFNGFKASAQTGISTYGDAPSDKFSLAFGTHVSDRGHFEISYEHSMSAGLNLADRSYTNDTPGYAGTGVVSNPYVLS